MKIIPSLLLGFLCFLRADDRPNVIFILADDMGYGDVQALNPKSKIPTPHLNRLAKEGMTFTDAHSPSAVCTPTRYSVLTGRYCWRSRLKSGVQNGYGTPLIEKERPTVASHLRQAGYHTAVIGKWHLGLGFRKDAQGQWDWSQPLDHSPVDLGFDRSLIIPASLDFLHTPTSKAARSRVCPTVLSPSRASRVSARRRAGSDFSIIDCLDRLTKESGDHIAKRAKEKKPFFLYFP